MFICENSILYAEQRRVLNNINSSENEDDDDVNENIKEIVNLLKSEYQEINRFKKTMEINNDPNDFVLDLQMLKIFTPVTILHISCNLVYPLLFMHKICRFFVIQKPGFNIPITFFLFDWFTWYLWDREEVWNFLTPTKKRVKRIKFEIFEKSQNFEKPLFF